MYRWRIYWCIQIHIQPWLPLPQVDGIAIDFSIVHPLGVMVVDQSDHLLVVPPISPQLGGEQVSIGIHSELISPLSLDSRGA